MTDDKNPDTNPYYPGSNTLDKNASPAADLTASAARAFNRAMESPTVERARAAVADAGASISGAVEQAAAAARKNPGTAAAIAAGAAVAFAGAALGLSKLRDR